MLFCFCDERQIWSSITDYCVKDGYLYVLYGHKSILKIYNDDGQYIKSYAFLSTNGVSSLYVDNEYVYLFDQMHNYYTFKYGAFINSYRYSDYETYKRKIADLFSGDVKRKSDDTIYYMKGASIYRKNADGSSIQLIHRPLYLLYFQGIIPIAGIAFWMVVFWILRMLSKKAPI